MKRTNLAGIILMIALLYPLSFGPVARIVCDPRTHFTDESQERMFALYDPLLSVPVLGGVVRWYLRLCLRDLTQGHQMGRE